MKKHLIEFTGGGPLDGIKRWVSDDTDAFTTPAMARPYIAIGLPDAEASSHMYIRDEDDFEFFVYEGVM